MKGLIKMIEPMPAITIWQPWASLIGCGAKRFETRGWATQYRGPIAIHAGLYYANSFFAPFGDTAHRVLREKLPGFTFMHDLPRGCVIATAELVGCHKIHSRYSDGAPCIHCQPQEANMQEIAITRDEFLFGDWTPGRYAWELRNVQLLPEPIPAKGRQGLWRWEGVAWSVSTGIHRHVSYFAPSAVKTTSSSAIIGIAEPGC